MSYFIGVDLGQPAEPTAIVVVESDTLEFLRTDRLVSRTSITFQPVFRGKDGNETHTHPPVTYSLRHIERLKGGDSYPAIIEHVHALASRLHFPELVIDSTGVGSAVTGLFTDANFANPARFVEVVGGDVVSEEWPTCKVPKRELVSTAQVLLQTNRLKIARGLPHAALLLRELVNFRFRIELKSSRETPELWREGPSDDLVLALATALWFAERNSGIPGGMSVGRSEFCDGLL